MYKAKKLLSLLVERLWCVGNQSLQKQKLSLFAIFIYETLKYPNLICYQLKFFQGTVSKKLVKSLFLLKHEVSLFANLYGRPVQRGRAPHPNTNHQQWFVKVWMSYSNNLYKYIRPGWLSVPVPLSSIRVLVCVWKTYYYYCIINKEDVQACLVSICIMYVPLSKIECNSRNIVLSLGLISYIYIWSICLPQVETFPRPRYLHTIISIWIEHQSVLRRETFYQFLFVWVCLFKFPHLHKLLEYYFKRLSHRLSVKPTIWRLRKT